MTWLAVFSQKDKFSCRKSEEGSKDARLRLTGMFIVLDNGSE